MVKEHTISWYEASNGKIFTDEMECYNYELNLLYKNSGVSFYADKEKIEWLTDESYNDMTDIMIDRSKAEENKALQQFLYENYGWCEVDKALDGTGSHYCFSDSPFDPIQEVTSE